ncbi:hypothetical protein HDU88_003773 [Geranomyces variabilis]|nr:hypothetical protein HDU88_003773 [Geranomyces variabilis]
MFRACAAVRRMHVSAVSPPATSSRQKDHVRAVLTHPEVVKNLSQTHAWAILCSAVASANRPALLAPALEVLNEKPVDVATRICLVKKGREAIYKTYTVAGMPRTINALSEFKAGIERHWPAELAAVESESASDEKPALDGQEIRNRGQSFFNLVYAKTAPRLQSLLAGLHPNLLAVIIDDAYGKVLSDVSVLDGLETELVMVGALEVQGGAVAKQVESHRRGAMRLNASAEQVAAAQLIAREVISCEEWA